MLGAERLQLISKLAGVADQPLDVDPHALRAVWFQLCEPLAKLRDGASPVPALPVIEPDADLEDPLVEVPNAIRFRDPDRFQRFMLLKELSAVELLDPMKELVGRTIIATRGARGRGFFDPRVHAEDWLTVADARAVLPSGEAAGNSR